MPKPELYKEYPQPDEEALITELIGILERLIEKPFLTGTTYRDTHAKGHATARAIFKIEDDLPADLRVGLFARPASYEAWVRFSNLSPTPQKDSRRDIRAMAIKLLNVPGERLWRAQKEEKTLDLILMGSQTFLAPDLPTFVAMEKAILKGGSSTLLFYLTHPRIFWTVLSGQKQTANVLEIPYWSQTAYAFGDKAIQYHMRPLTPKRSNLPKNPRNNYLRLRLAEQLSRESVSFEFMVQLQTDPVRMPIENPMVAWSPALSPYRRVATLTLPRQDGLLEPERLRFTENISFTPWRTLPELRPLGGINRARLRVYPTIAGFRHRKNAVSYQEPGSHTIQSGTDRPKS